MTSLSDDLRVLLNNPPGMMSAYEYYAGELLQSEHVAEQVAIKALSQWIKDVETVLELAETECELQIWQKVYLVVVHALAELAHLAEAVGWDGFFIEDYITHWLAPDAPTLDPWIGLAAAAMRTKRIRLGITVTPLSRRRPWKVAREAVTLEHLSNGRLILGVGLGGASDPMNFDRFGEVTELSQRAEIVDEALDIIADLWRGRPFRFQGKHYQIDEVTFLPTPLQKPRIPIWIGGDYLKKGPRERAARWDGSCLYKGTPGTGWQDMTPEDVRALRAFVERRQPAPAKYDIAVGGRQRAEDWEQDRAHIRSVAEAGATWWIEFIEPTSLDRTREGVMRGPLS